MVKIQKVAGTLHLDMGPIITTFLQILLGFKEVSNKISRQNLEPSKYNINSTTCKRSYFLKLEIQEIKYLNKRLKNKQ
jgi:hypothetical protein